MPITIKRYPNRKLYDTTEKQYITLERIADLIRDGREVVVVDNATGEDLTAVTFTQIIFEQEKKQSGFLPRPVLTGLVRSGGNTLEGMRRALTAPLELLRHVDDEIERRVELLVNTGSLTPEEGQVWLDKLLSVGNARVENVSLFEKTVVKYLSEHGVPSQNEYDHLIQQIELLMNKVDQLNQDKPAD